MNVIDWLFFSKKDARIKQLFEDCTEKAIINRELRDKLWHRLNYPYPPSLAIKFVCGNEETGIVITELYEPNIKNTGLKIGDIIERDVPFYGKYVIDSFSCINPPFIVFYVSKVNN